MEQHILKIVQAYLDGKKIESRSKGSEANFYVIDNPKWNFGEREYRIKEDVKPSIDWNQIHEDWKYLAVDSDDSAYVYQERPSATNRIAWSFGGQCIRVDFLFTSYKRGDCDWKDSLVERPSQGCDLAW